MKPIKIPIIRSHIDTQTSMVVYDMKCTIFDKITISLWNRLMLPVIVVENHLKN